MHPLSLLFNRVFPCYCLVCDQRTQPGQNFCQYCYLTLPFINAACPVCAAVLARSEICGRCLAETPFFDASTSVFEFTEPISHYIYQYKYQDRFFLGKVLSLELATAVSSFKPGLPDLIVPVPLHQKRLRQRGFNQSAMIARHVARKIKIPFKNNYLCRHKFVAPQTELNARQRRDAVKNAFSVNQQDRYTHIALVDDVVTTTHTVNQAARALKTAGTQFVSVWSVARNT